MANTFIAIQTVTVGSGGVTSIDFTSIPQTYTDLMFVFSMRQDTDDRNVLVKLNNSSSSIYSGRYLMGANGTTYTGTDSNNTNFVVQTGTVPSPATGSVFGNCTISLPRYTDTSANKSIFYDTTTENAASGSAGSAIYTGVWASTAAINRVTLTPWASKFVQYSTITLYGIKNS